MSEDADNGFGSCFLLEEATRLLGTEKRDLIWARWGGRTLYVPMRPEHGHPLIKLVGLRETATLCDAVGGVKYVLPMYKGYGSMSCREVVRLRTLAGDSLSAIAEVAGCTERNVSEHRRKLREEGKLPR